MNHEPLTLIGHFIRLEPLTLDHVPDLAIVGQDESIWQWMIYSPLTTEAKMRTFVQEMLTRQSQGADLPFAVIHLETGQAIGCTRFSYMQPYHRKVEIGGTWYGVDYQRTPVNTECKYLMLRHAFEVWQVRRVQFTADLMNVRSQKAITRLGAIKEGVLRNHLVRADGSSRHSAMFSLLDTEWWMTKPFLEMKLRDYQA